MNNQHVLNRLRFESFVLVFIIQIICVATDEQSQTFTLCVLYVQYFFAHKQARKMTFLVLALCLQGLLYFYLSPTVFYARLYEIWFCIKLQCIQSLCIIFRQQFLLSF